MDKENCIVVIALHKSGIERARIFELLKLLNNTRVFMYRTVKLFLDTGGVLYCIVLKGWSLLPNAL